MLLQFEANDALNLILGNLVLDNMIPSFHGLGPGAAALPIPNLSTRDRLHTDSMLQKRAALACEFPVANTKATGEASAWTCESP